MYNCQPTIVENSVMYFYVTCLSIEGTCSTHLLIVTACLTWLAYSVLLYLCLLAMSTVSLQLILNQQVQLQDHHPQIAQPLVNLTTMLLLLRKVSPKRYSQSPHSVYVFVRLYNWHLYTQPHMCYCLWRWLADCGPVAVVVGTTVTIWLRIDCKTIPALGWENFDCQAQII